MEEGKGNGKSPWAAGTGMYCLLADGEARAEVYAAASKRDQAMVLPGDVVFARTLEAATNVIERVEPHLGLVDLERPGLDLRDRQRLADDPLQQVLEGDESGAWSFWKDGHSIAFAWRATPRGQGATCQVGQNAARSGPTLRRELFGTLQNVFINIERRSHVMNITHQSSDVNAEL